MSTMFSENLRLLCAERPSIAQICREIGVNRQQFNRYLSGESLPSAHNLYRIARHFGVSEKDLFDDHDLFRKARTSRVPSADGPAGRIVEAFESQSASLRRYLGFYHVHFQSPAWPECIMRSLIWLREDRGYVVTHSFERADDPKGQVRLRTRYTGLATWRGSHIYVFERAFTDDGFLSETILYPPHRQQVSYVRGLTMGVASRPRLTPYASPAIWKRVPERVSPREAIEATGVFRFQSSTIDPTIREYLSAAMLQI